MKRVVRRKILKVMPHRHQAWFVWAAVLLFFVVLLLQQRKQPVNVKPIIIGWGQIYSNQYPVFKSDRWKDHKGWWGGYWWGNDSFFWRGREWGLGKSPYPWYWEHDKLALELDLAELASTKRWSQVESNILKKISELEQEIQVTDNKATKRKLERTVDRLRYYLYDTKKYQQTLIQF